MKNLRTPAFLAAAAVAAGLAAGTLLPTAPSPSPATPSPSVTAVTCQEDMPCWACTPNDDRCKSSDPYAEIAWRTFEEEGGARSLKVDPSRPFRVDYVGSTDGVPENTDAYDLVLTGKDFRSYIFRAAYTD